MWPFQDFSEINGCTAIIVKTPRDTLTSLPVNEKIREFQQIEEKNQLCKIH